VTFTFLAVNGVAITADEDATIRFLIRLYDRNALAFDKLDAWLRKNTNKQ